MNSLWKKRIISSLSSTVLCALMLLLLEAGTRIFRPEINFQETEKRLLRNKVFGDTVGLVPNASGISFGVPISIDELGFRRVVAPENYSSSWLILGDSVTFGVGVKDEHTYIQLLQNSLPTVKLWNTAVLGYNLKNYKDVLHHLTVEKQAIPNLKKVLLFYCLNDVDLQSTFGNNPNISPYTSDYAEKVISFLRRNSKFYAVMKNAVSDRSKVYFDHDYQIYKSADGSFTEAINIIDEMDAHLRNRNIDFEIVILPYEYQLRTKEEQFLLPQKLLTAHFKEKKIPHIDIYPDLERAGGDQKKNYLYADFCHFSREGNQLVANILKGHFQAE